MNKSDLISSIAELSGLTKVDSEKALSAFIETVEKALKEGDEIRLIGFGTFLTQQKPESIARNIRTGEKIMVPARQVPKFKPGQNLKDAVACKK